MDLCFSYHFTTYKLEPMIALVLFYWILKPLKNAGKDVTLMPLPPTIPKLREKRRQKHSQSVFYLACSQRDRFLLVRNNTWLSSQLVFFRRVFVFSEYVQ